jgi:hypothetical protein
MSEPQSNPPNTPTGVAPRHGDVVHAVHDDHHAPTIARNARVGIWLFLVYLLLYAGFMALNAFYPQRMADAGARRRQPCHHVRPAADRRRVRAGAALHVPRAEPGG